MNNIFNFFYSFLFYFYIEYDLSSTTYALNSNITAIDNSMLFNEFTYLSQMTLSLCYFFVFYLFFFCFYILKIKIHFNNQTVNNFFSFKSFYNYLFSINRKRLGLITTVFYSLTKYFLCFTLALICFSLILCICLIFISIINGGLVDFLYSIRYYHNNFFFLSYQGLDNNTNWISPLEIMGVSYSDNNNNNSDVILFNRNRGAISSTPLPLRNDLDFYTDTIFFNKLEPNVNPWNPMFLKNTNPIILPNGEVAFAMTNLDQCSIEHHIKIVRETGNIQNISILGYVKLPNSYLNIQPDDGSFEKYYRTVSNIFNYSSSSLYNINYINNLNNSLIVLLNDPTFINPFFAFLPVQYSSLSLLDTEKAVNALQGLNELLTIFENLNKILSTVPLNETYFHGKLSTVITNLSDQINITDISYSRYKGPISASELELGYALNAQTLIAPVEEDSSYFYLLKNWGVLEQEKLMDYKTLQFWWNDGTTTQILNFNPSKISIAVSLEDALYSDSDSDIESSEQNRVRKPSEWTKFRINLVSPLEVENNINFMTNLIRTTATVLNKEEVNTALLELKISNLVFYYRLFNTSALLLLERDLNNIMEDILIGTPLNLDSIPTLYLNNSPEILLLP